MKILALLLALVLARWLHEAWRHRRALAAVPIRIHVNGSRGKSSVTRLLAAALREGGIRTCAKTTGSSARYILPDGNEEPIVRIGSPNIVEQIGILDRTRREGAKALVIECMAIRPDLQRLSEHRIVNATIGVITNARADHLDVMGPAVSDVAVALSSTIPRNRVAVIGESRFRDTYEAVARDRGSQVVIADVDRLPAGAMEGFAYVEHPDNVATVLAVTRQLDIDDEVALRGMRRAAPDVGACTSALVRHSGCSIQFVNAFAANDLESTIAIWKRLGFDASAESGPTVALVNLRRDRLDRSLRFAEAVDDGLRADHYILIGDYQDSVVLRFRRRIPDDRLASLGRAPAPAVFDEIARRCRRAARVGGMGNIGGVGHDIMRFVVRQAGNRC